MMNFYSNIPTELHLNGPNVKFSTNPINVSASLAGVATFTAISTATFPYNNTNGTFDFQWYFGGNAINDTSKKKGYRLVGDCDFDDVINKVSAITPVPGGVGPMTIALLLKHTVNACINYL